MLTVAHNMAAMNTQRQLNTNTKNRAKATEKLASGYKINRAADDAAGLSISEKMRQLIRGLDQGTDNAQDGISWTQIGDGALNEAHDILQRMNELSVQALNGTNSQSDRDAIQAEFDQLQTELDRISLTTEFNELNVFNKHKSTYYQCEGAIQWDPKQTHAIYVPRNDLTVKYRANADSPQSIITITVPEGKYTTQELADEIDSALEEAGAFSDGIYFELNDEGYCNVNYEGGKVIDVVSGALSYLLYDMYEGGEFGALIGTTSFEGGYPLKITSENNTLSFKIQDFDGNETDKTIVIPDGWYYREQIIDLLNNELSGTTVTATEYGSGIKLGSDDSIVTKFKGNMFKIDSSGSVYTSVFYDNVSYGAAELTSGSFQGGYVLTSSAKDEEYNKFIIKDDNNTLSIQTNGMDAPVSITIPNGKYSISEMESTLDSLFDTAQLGVDVSYKLSSDGFYGLTITSDIEGKESTIDIDPNSSAYNTLFVTKKYTRYSTEASISNESRTDQVGSFTGSKDLSTLSTTPLTVTAGTNDQFSLTIKNADNTSTSKTITLSPQTYNSIQAVVDEINAQLSKNSITNVEAVVSGSKIKLQGTSDSTVTTITASAVSQNTGFDEVLQGYTISYKTTTNSGTGSITLGNPYDGTIDSTETPLKITVGGTLYEVKLPVGNTSQSDIISAIHSTIPGSTETIYNRFNNTSATGKTNDKGYSAQTYYGATNTGTWSDSDVGETKMQEGTTMVATDRPASITIDIALPSSMTVTDSNNTITFKINDKEQTLILDNKTYTPSQLKDALQAKIDAVYGSGFGGAKVTLDGNKLVLTARTDATNLGENTSISGSISSKSTFLQELATTRKPATLTSKLTLANEIVIDSTTNEFAFTLKENGVSTPVTITLDEGTYDPDSLVDEINSKLQGVGVTADKSPSGYLTLTSDAVGRDVSISYGTTSGGSSSSVLFGELITKEPANAIVYKKTEDTITIDNSTNGFTIRVNGDDYSVTLDSDSYDREGFVQMLNQKLQDANAGIEAYVSGEYIGYKTTAAGKQQSFLITYDDGGTSMAAIYGKQEIKHPGVTASFTADGNLKLETDSNTSISVSSNSGGGFQTSTEVKTPINNSSVTGYFSNKQGTIDGASLSTPIIIDEFSDDLSFTYEHDGTTDTISITVTQGTYDYAGLQTELQKLLDNAAGKDNLLVTVNSSGVVIKTAGIGIGNRLSYGTKPSGDFYEKILCRSTEHSETKTVTDKDGTQTISDTFTVGRKDIVSNGVTIRDGISDELSLDFTYDNTVYTLEMNLDAGKYTSSEIKKHIQEKLNEELIANGFNADLIEVGVGDIRTGVVGANDSRAINFKLNNDIAVPGEGSYIIDGVGGNAAFEVFYSTDGELIPAYIMGNKNVSEGITIKDGETDLSISVDGVAYDVTFEVKDYTAEEAVNAINEQLEAASAPLIAELDEGQVKLSYVSLGKHTLEIEGSARDEIFFRENGEEGPSVGINIQLSSEVGDLISIPRTDVSTTLLGINTICVTKESYAFKALARVGEAIDLVSALRSTFGSVQNRLEHAINNNENKHENTTAAESRIRDTDMAETMVDLSKQNILHQVGQAMLAQANSRKEDVLTLLQ